MTDSDNLRPIRDYPDVNFIEGYTVEKLAEDMMSWFKTKKKELTGEDIVLGKADDRSIILQTGAYFIFQGYMFSDDAGKMGLLKYSRGKFLENLGALKHIYRKRAAGATTTIRFSLSGERATTTGIPKGTRLTAGDSVYFATDEYCEILTGEIFVDVRATCLAAGSAGNDYGVGEISTIVDPIPYVESGENITRPENGSDEEDDESLKQRIYVAPSAYSTAGTRDAYEYFVRKFNPEITDVKVTSPEACVVRIRYLLKSGEVPGPESIKELKLYLSEPEIKPLTDKVEVMAPELTDYNLNVMYYINMSDKSRAEIIQSKVTDAINGFKIWQKSKMGRDINPDELIRRVLDAGAKRAVIAAPAFKTVPEDSVASLKEEIVTYGGMEDD